MTKLAKGGVAHELSKDINVIIAEINAYQRVAGEAIFEIGKRLKHVKENDLAHGEWRGWLENVGMSERQSSRFIRVYERFESSPPVASLNLPLSVMDALTTLSDEELTQEYETPSGERKKPTEMSRREIDEYKRALKEAEKAKEEAEESRKLAEQQAKVAQQSEDNVRRQLEEFENGTPEVEIRTEYVEVEVRDESLDHRLREYEERFGAIENYTDRQRATNLAEVTTSVMTFSKAVRDLAKRHAYLIQYQDTVSALDPVTKQEYNEAVTALTDLARDFGTVSGQATIIDMK